MEIKNFTYLLLLAVYLIVPLVLSFRGRVRFVFQLRYILPAVIFSTILFVMWDIRFTKLSIWTFNPQYLTGIEILNLPIEEWLSFVVVSLSSVYIYEWMKAHMETVENANVFVVVSLVLLAITAVLAYTFRARMFAFFTFFLSAIYLGYTVFRNNFKLFYTKFYLSWIVSLIPYLIVYAILDSLPAITYDVNHIIGMAVVGVPVERIAYLFLLLLINTTIYEYLSNRKVY